MSTKTRGRLAWAVNALSVVVLICFGLWSLQLREQQQVEIRRAQVIASAISESNTATIGVSAEGIITEWNGAAEKLTGYSADEAIGWGLKFLIPLASQPAHIRGISAAVERGALSKPVQIVRCSIVHKDKFHVRVVFSLRMVKAGDTVFVVQMDQASDVLEIDTT